MSTSLLYHAFGVRGYQYVQTDYGEGAVRFTVEQPRESYRCPICGSDDVLGRGQNLRRFRTVPIGGKPAYIVLAVPRVECRRRGAVRQVRIRFADPRVSYTRSFKRYALELSRHMTIQDVAMHLGISWDVVKEIQKEDLQRRFGKTSHGPCLVSGVDLRPWATTARGRFCRPFLLPGVKAGVYRP